MCVRAYVHVCVSVRACVCVRMCLCLYVCVYVSVCVCVYVCACMSPRDLVAAILFTNSITYCTGHNVVHIMLFKT